MAINTYLSTIDSKKPPQNKWKSRTETDSEIQRTFWRLQNGRGFGGCVKEVKWLRSTTWLQSNHRDVEYSIGNRVNNTVTTMYGVRWVQGLWG